MANIFTVGKALVANTTTTLFTVPPKMVFIVRYLNMANNGTVNKTGSVHWEDSSESSSVHLFNGHIFAQGENKTFNDMNIRLQEGDSLKALSELGSTMSVIVTFECIQDDNKMGSPF